MSGSSDNSTRGKGAKSSGEATGPAGKKAAAKKTTAKKTTAKKAAAKKAAAKKAAPGTAPKAVPTATITAGARWRMVSEAAYLLAEKRNFRSGGETADWFRAEAQVDAQLREDGITVVS